MPSKSEYCSKPQPHYIFLSFLAIRSLILIFLTSLSFSTTLLQQVKPTSTKPSILRKMDVNINCYTMYSHRGGKWVAPTSETSTMMGQNCHIINLQDPRGSSSGPSMASTYQFRPANVTHEWSSADISAFTYQLEES